MRYPSRKSLAAALATLVITASTFAGPALADPDRQRTDGTAPEAHPQAPPRHDSAEVHWGYEGEIGPERWGDLSPDFCACRDGKEQSPIDLTDATFVEGPLLERRIGTEVLTFEERAHVMDLVDNGHTIQVTNDAPLSLDVEGETFQLVQYHFHAPSEHTVNGEHAPLEVHFVHRSAAGELAVAAILVREGEHDPMFDIVVDALPDGPGDKVHLEGLELDMNEVRPLPARFYRYEGSLTTPPCSEGVHWIVMEEWREISPDQMQALTSHLHDNNRPVQPRGDRELLLVSRED